MEIDINPPVKVKPINTRINENPEYKYANVNDSNPSQNIIDSANQNEVQSANQMHASNSNDIISDQPNAARQMHSGFSCLIWIIITLCSWIFILR